ncbi:hypothetical protein [Pedobacter sp. NJ-S-72]
MEKKYLNEYTWYYDEDGRIWMVLAVLLKDPLNQKVWLIEAGINEAKEHAFSRVANLILEGKLKPYVKPKLN